MEGYKTDDETLAALRGWWEKNGKYVVAGLVIAALVIGGWRLWGYWQGKRSAAAAGLYASLLAAEQKGDDTAVAKAAQAVISAYPDTAYGALAGLSFAKAELQQQNLQGAADSLQQVMQNSPDKGLAMVARLRLARVRIQAGDAKGALATLQAPVNEGPFTVSIDSIRGDAYVALGDRGKARQAYQAALARAGATSTQAQLLQMRLASLPVGANLAASAKAAPTTPVHAAAPASVHTAAHAAKTATGAGGKP